MARWLKKIFLGIGGITILFFLGLGVITLLLYLKGFFESPNLSRLQDTRGASIVYDSEGNALKEFCLYCREVIPLEDMGLFPKLAVAVEDRHFWSFWREISPFDFLAVLRAFWHNLKEGGITQGGSTITQQLARILFAEEELEREWESGKLSDKLWRKAREAYLATILQWRIDRKKILETYLNTVYCGNSRYGVKSCSRFYFDKDPKDLQLIEALTVAGLWRNPNASPFHDEEKALKLRNRALQQIANQDLISEEEKLRLEREKLPTKKTKDPCWSAPHFTEFIRRQIIEEQKFVDQGIRVYSTLENGWQKAACEALEASLEAMKQRNPELKNDLWGSAFLIDVRTGAIEVWAQYPTFKENEFLLNQSARQTGSAFKPFFYAAWIALRGGRLSHQDEGEGPAELDDSYMSHDGKSAIYIPMGRKKPPHFLQNFPYEGLPRYIGITEPINCIAQSRNVCTLSGIRGVRGSRVLFRHRITKEELIEFSLGLGINFPVISPETAIQQGIATVDPELTKHLGISPYTIDPGLTLPIGSVEVSLWDMVKAMAALGGNMVEPYAVGSAYDASGKLIFEKELEAPYQPLDDETTYAIIRGLRSTVELPHGTGKKAKEELNFQIMGKTGTANRVNPETGEVETTDNWFIGCTPQKCMGIWIGREKKLPLKTTFQNGQKIQETGGRNALPIFIKTMGTVYETEPIENFPEATDPLKPFRPSEYKYTYENGAMPENNDY
ncbi:MAG: penicillin-binding protein [Candidatus Sungiibacteriota bacterium]|uniref:peptidoglycan glycosyltransferase n=1 Tax=Candidatus Sungiibacteriota bacterium TaxID=2750080 RepID=A0A7T5RK13_9BACT|nr:MAG: penicillin-binding protein [Candidatus Sungbacteria bacterium]